LEELLTVRRVAEILRISEQAVYGLVARGRIPYVRFSHRGIRFRVEDFEQWLRSKTVAAKDQRRAYDVSSENGKRQGESGELNS